MSGYSIWADVGSLSVGSFEADGVSVRVLALAEHAGGLFLGLSREVPSEFVLSVAGREFSASQSRVAHMAGRGRYWWPVGAGLWGDGDLVDARIAVDGDAAPVPSRSPAPPSAYFDRVPSAHDGVGSFSVRLSFVGDAVVDAALLAGGAVAVSGGELVGVEESSGRWDVTVVPAGGGDVAVGVVGGMACAQPAAVCSGDGQRLQNSARVVVAGPDRAVSLSSLSLHGAVLDPVFDPSVVLYGASAAAGSAFVTVVAEPADAAATVSIEPQDTDTAPGHQVGLLAGGQTAVTVTVTASDGTTRRYWVIVERPAAPGSASPAVPALSGLALEGLAPLPFDADQPRYELDAAEGAAHTTVVIAAVEVGATVEVLAARGDDAALVLDPADSDPAHEGHQVRLSPTGDTLVLVVVTSADGLRQRTYVMLIAAPANQPQPNQPQPNQARSADSPGTLPGPHAQAAVDKSAVGKSAVGKSAVRGTRNLPLLGSLSLEAANSNAVSLGAVDLSPAFTAATTEYTASVTADTTSVTVTAVAADADASVAVTPADADPNTPGHQIALPAAAFGEQPTTTSIAVAVQAADATMNAYTITVTRAASTLPSGCALESLTQAQGAAVLTASGQWKPQCRSILTYKQRMSDPPGSRTTGFARFYELSVSHTAEVTIELTDWDTSHHYVLRAADGTQIGHSFYAVGYVVPVSCVDFEMPTCNDWPSQLEATLDAGDYIIEIVQHFSHDGRQKRFDLEVEVTVLPALDSLSLGAVQLHPVFDASTRAYNASVTEDISNVTVTAVAADADAKVTINGDGDNDDDAEVEVVLRAGVAGNPPATTSIEVAVQSTDGLRTSYTVTVARATPDLPLLESLSLGDVPLSPAFAAPTLAYTASVTEETSSVTVTADAADADASFTITPADADAGTPGHQVALNDVVLGGLPATTSIEVAVESADAIVNRYTVTVARAAPMLPSGCALERLSWNRDRGVTVVPSASLWLFTDGQWGPECGSILEYKEDPAGASTTGLARFYGLRVRETTDVRFWLTDVDTSHHYVLRNADGEVIDHVFSDIDYDIDYPGGDPCADLDECSEAASLLVEQLAAGDYVIEIIQHFSEDGRQRHFGVNVSVPSTDIGPLETAITGVLPTDCEFDTFDQAPDAVLTASGKWKPECESMRTYTMLESDLPDSSTTGFARFYGLTVSETADVVIRLTKYDTSHHYVLRDADGNEIDHTYFLFGYIRTPWCAEDDAIDPCNVWPVQLKAELAPGDYIIEIIQHFSRDGRQRRFDLQVAVPSTAISPLPTAISPLPWPPMMGMMPGPGD